MLKDPMPGGRRDKPVRRSRNRGRTDGPRPTSPFVPDRRGERDPREGPDPRATALRMISAFLTGKAAPPPGRGRMRMRMPMPAPPRQPVGKSNFPRPGRSAPPVVTASAPQVPFPTPGAAAAGHAPPSAMDVIARFIETARAGGLAAHRRRRG